MEGGELGSGIEIERLNYNTKFIDIERTVSVNQSVKNLF